MSTTTILAVWPFRRTEDLIELRNSWGFAPPIWDALSVKYFSRKMNIFELDYLWPLYKRSDVPMHHRAVLCMTFDNAYVRSKDYELAKMHIHQFLHDFPPIKGNVNHWSEIALTFKELPSCPAIGFWATSITDRPFQGCWDECVEDYKTFDWTKSFDVYDELTNSQ